MAAAARQLVQRLAEIEAGEVAARDQGDAVVLVPLAEQGEEERQLEDLQAARDERRQLLHVAAEVELDDPHAMAADAVDLQPLHHAVEDLQVPRVQRPGRPAPHRGEVAAAGQQPERRPRSRAAPWWRG